MDILTTRLKIYPLGRGFMTKIVYSSWTFLKPESSQKRILCQTVVLTVKNLRLRKIKRPVLSHIAD